MIVLISLIVALYSLIIVAFIVGYNRIENFNDNSNDPSQTSFSIIIPFRNEATALPELLASIAHLEYAKSHYELIFVDDASDDNSIEIIEQSFNTKYIALDVIQPDFKIIPTIRKTNSPKKDAINAAVQKAKYEWIITTDADCIVPKKWLQTFNNFILYHKPKLIVAPVTYQANSSFFAQFQLLDFLSLQGSTIGGFGIKKPFLCNGANLCYSKEAFFEVNGFEDNAHIASGDDIFLLEKMVLKFPDKVHYLKSHDAIVTTKPQSTLKQLVAQRSRWASKTTAYKNGFSKLVSIAVFLMNFLLIVLLMGSVLGINSWPTLFITFLIKFSIDFMLFIKTTTFFKQTQALKYVVLSSVIYPFFILAVVVESLRSDYIWKGRTFKK